MELVETKTGKWYVETSGELHGEIPALLRAYCVAGETADTNYSVFATIRIVKGTTASIIVFYSYGTTEKYLEFVLDSVQDKVLLDKVENDVRTNLVTANYTIDSQKEYECQVTAKSTNEIICSINGATVIKTTAPTDYTAGKHGYACQGTLATDYSLFNKVVFQKSTLYAQLGTIISAVGAIKFTDVVGETATIQDYCDFITQKIEDASRFFDGETQNPIGFFQEGGIEIVEYADGKGATAPADYPWTTTGWTESAATFFLESRPVLNISKIEENKAEIGETEDWQETTKFLWYKHGEIVFATASIPAKARKNVKITYKAGYNITPLDVQMAIARLVVNLIHKLVSDRTTSFISFARPTAINFGMPDVLTPDVKTVIQRYRRLSYGGM